MSLVSVEARPAQPVSRVSKEELPKVPYRGIEPFRYEDRHIFFGRSVEIQKLVRSINIYRGFLLYGDSGAGKSSLINAGLLPALSEDGFLPHRLRIQPRAGSEFVFERIVVRAAEPVPECLGSLFPDWDPKEPRREASLAELKKLLGQTEVARTPVLIFDQFEELVTLFEPASQGDKEEPKRIQQSICQFLIGLLRDHSVPVKLLFSFREDYLGKLRELLRGYPDLMDHFFRLESLSADALEEVIRGPFTSARLPEGHFPERISKPLAEDLTKELVARSVDGRPSLSEVQVACLRLWQASNPNDCFAQRRVKGLLEDYLEQSLEGISRERRDIATAILGALVTPSRTRNVVSESSLLQTVGTTEGLASEEVRRVLAQLESGTRVVQHEVRRGERYYELVSEFLIDWILREDAQRIAQRRWKKRLRQVVGVGSVLTGLAIAGSVTWSLNVDFRVKKEREVRYATEAMLRAQTERDVTEEQLRAKQAELVGLQESWASKTRYYEDRIKDEAVATDGVRKQLVNTKSQLKAVEGEKKTLTEQLEATRAQLKGVEGEKKTLSEQLENTRTQLTTVGGEKKALAEQLETTKAQLKTVEGEKKTVAEQLGSTKAQLKTAEAQLKTAEAQLKTVEGEKKTLAEQLGAAQTELTSLRQRPVSCPPQVPPPQSSKDSSGK